jgi:peptidoglycan hydrolase CwlO-like protein
MKKTLQECKEIVADKNHGLDFEWCTNYLSSNRIIELTDLANKMYYEQSECEITHLKTENQNLINEIHQLRLRINNIYDNC